jgi:DNA-binding NarL/FixJ family response regulator
VPDVSQARIRIVIVDDHPFVREGLRARLSTVPTLEVVAEAGDAEEGLRLVEAFQPDLVLADIGMKGTNGLEMTRLLLQKNPKLAVLILSMFDKPEYVQQAMQAGARGYVVKDSTSAQIVQAIESVASGGTYLSPTVAESLFAPKNTHEILSQREQEILRCIAKGQPSKLIARELDISVRTVESHRQSIKRKLCIDGQAELVKFAVERFSM